MPPRIPTDADFAVLSSILPLALHFPSPPETTSTFLILFHGMGDHEAPFANFARSLSLPGVLAIAVQGTTPLPSYLLPDDDTAAAAAAAGRHSHWGDDLSLDPRTGDLASDPGFDKAANLVMRKLVKETLLDKCGWAMSDILFFGFGQGGSLALGLASRLRTPQRIVDVSEGEGAESNELGKACKGAVSIGGPLPSSMIPSLGSRDKCDTPVLVCQLDDEDAATVKREFKDVRVANWKRKEVAMPRDRDEMLPVMKFFADQLNGRW